MIQYDIRVVRMAKSTQETKLSDIIDHMKEIDEKRRTKKKSKPVNMCLCLGHFDVMMIDQLNDIPSEQNSPIKLVDTDYNRAWDLPQMLKLTNSKDKHSLEANYYYPIYMLMQYDESKKYQKESVEAFWKKNQNYVVVTRLHQDYDSIVHNSDQFKSLLKDRILESSKVDSTTFSKSTIYDDVYFYLEVIRDGGKSIVYCILYDSLELGDVICVFKSNLLSSILEVQRWLYESPDVSDAYSYCGIHYRNFVTGDKEFPKETDSLRSIHLDYVETRFSVKSSDLAWNYFQKELKEEGYFVIGNADALSHHKNMQEKNLLENINKLVGFQGMYTTFYDVVTRVGLTNRKPIRGAGYIPKQREQHREHITLKPKTLEWLCKKYKATNHPNGGSYAYALTKLLSSLNAMYTNSVTDALSMLMYDGIEALIQRLDYCTQRDSWEKESGEELQEFLDQWTATTTAILHLESQLSQHPELVPVRYYIPAMILQFEQLIVDKGMEALCAIDGDSSYRFAPIMFPRSQSNTTTKAILDPKSDPEYSGKVPLRILIPIHMLYHPWRVSHILCHEIAHYCGNQIRNRALRNENIRKSTAYFVASRMIGRMGITEEILNLKQALEDATCELESYMKNNLHIGRDTLYLNDIISEIQSELPKLVARPEVTGAVIRSSLNQVNPIYQDRAASRISIENYTVCDEIVKDTQQHLELCLRDLYSECFADVAMILLTHCSFNEYYAFIFDDEYENLKANLPEEKWKQDDNIRLWFEHHTDRIALVACCIEKVGSFSGWLLNAEESKFEWQRIAHKKVREWKKQQKNTVLQWHKEFEGSANYSIALQGFEANYLLNYLDQCAKDIHKRMMAHGFPGRPISPVSQLRDRIKLLNPKDMDWNALQKILIQNMKEKSVKANPNTCIKG